MTRTLLLSLAFAAIGLAQTTLTLTGPASATAGASVPLTLSIAGTSGQNVSGIQWSIVGPTGLSVTSATITASPAALGKGLYCSANNAVCLEIGDSSTSALSNNPWTADGTIATFQVAVALNTPLGATTVPLSGLFAVSTTGSAITMTSGTAYTLTILQSHCDFNGDGKVDSTDVLAAINAVLGRASCPSILASCSLLTIWDVLQAANGGACVL